MNTASVRRRTRTLFALSMLAMAQAVPLSATETASANWPQFRGANASGLAAGAKPPVKFGPTENVVWSVDIPWSPSSPAIWGERIFLTTFRDGELETRCHDRADGKLRWARGVKPGEVEEFHRSDGSPAASSPATDGQRVVSYFGSFGLICYDIEGKELWRYPLPVALSGGKYGSGTSPILIGTTVLLNRDQDRYSSLLALDLRTGKKLWEVARVEASGSFGSPTHWRNEGIDEVVLASSAQLKGYDLKTGSERWVVTNVSGLVCTTAIVAEGMLFFGAWSPGQADAPREPWPEFLKKNDKNGDGVVTFDEFTPARRDYVRGIDKDRDDKLTEADWTILAANAARAQNLLLAVRPGGLGDITETHVTWRYRKGLPYVPSPLHYDGRIYLVKDGGLMSSIDAKTGEPYYAQERIAGAPSNYYAAPVGADGRVFVASLPGILTVVKAGGDKPEILHQVDFGERILATPALVGERIYVRTMTKLWAFGNAR